MKKNCFKAIIIEDARHDLEAKVNGIFDKLAPKSFNGMRVLVKPNMLGPAAPELGHSTHPEVVRAIVRACLSRGAKVTVGDNPGGINRSSTGVAQVTGILEASEGCFAPIGDKVVEMRGSKSGHTLMISRVVLDADYVINAPIFKTHAGMYLSGAMKNLYGYVAGACKAQLHLKAPSREEFAEVLCDINEVRHPDLNIMDALTVLEGNGPSHGGVKREVGKVFASNNTLVADTVMAAMVGVEPMRFPVTKRGQERGFGTTDLSQVEVEGNIVVIPDFKLPNTFIAEATEEMLTRAAQANKMRDDRLAELLPGRLSVKPLLAIDKCLQCGDCEVNCPAQALTLDPYPVINDKCIQCFCCVELCLEGALEVPDVAAFRAY
ncbi:MAG: DUF362 domain-containing protein [Dehalococcoidia bacterium]|nr:DUF362 domain-containing protein [Dehalococcoidia bacterium]